MNVFILQKRSIPDEYFDYRDKETKQNYIVSLVLS